MTRTPFNSELAAICEERDHVTILMNLKQTGEVSGGPKLNTLRDRLEELEHRARVVRRGIHVARAKGRRANSVSPR